MLGSLLPEKLTTFAKKEKNRFYNINIIKIIKFYIFNYIMKGNKMTKVEKAIEILKNHQDGVAVGSLKAALKTTDSGVRATISRVRREGFAVYLNEGKLDSRGRQLSAKYRIGAPTREMVATYYAVMGA